MSTKPTILVFIDWYKPAYKAGGPITSCVNLIEALKNTINFKVFTSCYDYLETKPLKGIELDKWVKTDGIEIFYASKIHQNRKFVKKLIRTTSHNQLLVNGVFSPIFSISPLVYRRKDIPCIISSRGMLGKNVLQFKSTKKQAFLRFSKLMQWHNGIRFHATNDSEKKDILKIFPQNEVFVAPNVPSRPLSMENVISKGKGELKILQVARIAKEKNTLFAIQALKGIKGKVHLDIVGSIYDEQYAERCKKTVNQLNDNISVKLLGARSPFELQKLYGKYHTFYLPTLGENFGHAISESLSNGLPNIISNQTIWRDLEIEKAGFDLGLNQEIFQTRIQKFVDMEETEFELWRKGAKAYFNKKVNWQEILNQNKKLFYFE